MLKKLSAFAVLAGLCLSLSAAAENFVVISYPAQYWVVGKALDSVDANLPGVAEGKTVTLHTKGNPGDVIAAGVVSGNDYIINLYDAFFVPVENNAVYQVSVIRENPEDYGAGPEDVIITGKGWNQAPDLQLEKGAGPVKPPADAVPLKIIRVNNDNDIQISWGTNDPKYAQPQIFVLPSIGDEVGQYANAYDPAKWLPVTSDVIKSEFDDVTEVGLSDGFLIHKSQSGKNSTRREVYYKALVKGVDINLPAAQETYKLTPAVGKFDVEVGPEPEKFFISAPLVQTDPSLGAVFGDQINDYEGLAELDDYAKVTVGAYRVNGKWGPFPGAKKQDLLAIQLGHSYALYTSTPRKISLVGSVLNQDYSTALAGGPTADPTWISSPYPASIAINQIGLDDSSFSGDITLACKLKHLDPSYKTFNDFAGMAFHVAVSTWKDGGLTNPATLQVVPGRGYYLREPVKDEFSWQIKNPF